jgi:hypothetical protein
MATDNVDIAFGCGHGSNRQAERPLKSRFPVKQFFVHPFCPPRLMIFPAEEGSSYIGASATADLQMEALRQQRLRHSAKFAPW